MERDWEGVLVLVKVNKVYKSFLFVVDFEKHPVFSVNMDHLDQDKLQDRRSYFVCLAVLRCP